MPAATPLSGGRDWGRAWHAAFDEAEACAKLDDELKKVREQWERRRRARMRAMTTPSLPPSAPSPDEGGTPRDAVALTRLGSRAFVAGKRTHPYPLFLSSTPPSAAGCPSWTARCARASPPGSPTSRPPPPPWPGSAAATRTRARSRRGSPAGGCRPHLTAGRRMRLPAPACRRAPRARRRRGGLRPRGWRRCRAPRCPAPPPPQRPGRIWTPPSPTWPPPRPPSPPRWAPRASARPSWRRAWPTPRNG